MGFSAQGMLFRFSSTTGVSTATGTSISEIKSYSFSVPSRTMLDDSHLGSTMESKKPGILKGSQVKLDMNFIATDAGQLAMRGAAISTVLQSLWIGFSDTAKTCVAFDGYISAFDPSAGMNEINKLSVTFDVVSPGSWATYA